VKPTADYRQALDAAVWEFEALGQKRREIDDRLVQLSQTIDALKAPLARLESRPTKTRKR